MKKIKPYKYNLRRRAAPEYTPAGVNRIGTKEQLYGEVQGKKASDLEERMANAFSKLGTSFEFRARISSLALGQRRLTKVMANLPGELEIDHLVYSGQVIPILVQGEIAHFMTPYQRLQDAEKISAINEFGRALGWREVVEVPFTEIKNQEEADSVAMRILSGTYITQYAR